MVDERLETPKQLAKRLGISERKVRWLLQSKQLEYVMIGCRAHIPEGAFRRFIAARKVAPCPDEIKDQDCAGSRSESAFTSPGPNRAAAASARLARQTAKKLKSSFAEWLQSRGRRAGPSDPAAVLITDILNEYADKHGAKTAAPERIGYAVEALTDFFESNSIADVTPQSCGRYVEIRGRSIGTARRELGVLRAAINYAFRNGRITRTVAVELPDQPEPRDRWLTRTEVAHLIKAARTPQARLYLPLFVLIAIYTGRRKEAILSLRWPQVNLDTRKINFEVSGRRRTNKRRGIVPIPERLIPHLQRAQRRGTELGYVLHINGKRISDIKKGFAAACKRADLQGVAPHTLGHTCATWLMQNGTDLWQASGFLSMSMETLQRVYAHHHPDYQREAAENVGRRPQIVRVIA
jgi:excisionase family DNA binding protein